MSKLKRASKAVAILVALVCIWLGTSWFLTSPPRHVWFYQETVTVTRTAAPWWMAGIEVLPVAAIILLIWVMNSIGPRRFF